MVLPDGPEAAVAFTGVAAAAICAPLNPRFKYDEFDYYLMQLGAKALVVQSGVDSAAVAVAYKRNLPVFKLTPVLDAAAGIFILNINAAVPAIPPTDSDRASRGLVLLTSGTTSRSKLVPLSEVNIFAAAHAIQQALEISSNDRYLNVAHLFYSQGIMLSLASLLVRSQCSLSDFVRSGALLSMATRITADVVLGCADDPSHYSDSGSDVPRRSRFSTFASYSLGGGTVAR